MFVGVHISITIDSFAIEKYPKQQSKAQRAHFGKSLSINHKNVCLLVSTITKKQKYVAAEQKTIWYFATGI